MDGLILGWALDQVERSRGIPALLHQHVEHLAFIIDRAP
jgi:hypothetical protein